MYQHTPNIAKLGSNLTSSWRHQSLKMAHDSPKMLHQSPGGCKPRPFRPWSDQMVRKYELRFC
eukprot:7234550-Karenia_brevis.AAC.1